MCRYEVKTFRRKCRLYKSWYRNVIEFLKVELQRRETTEKAINILKDTAAFKQYCALRKNEVNNRAKLHMEFGNMNEELYDIFLMEFYAFGLSNLANHTRKKITDWRSI